MCPEEVLGCRLTIREQAIYDLLVVTWLMDKEIADALNIEQSTLNVHKASIYLKLGVHSRLELCIGYWRKAVKHEMSKDNSSIEQKNG